MPFTAENTDNLYSQRPDGNPSIKPNARVFKEFHFTLKTIKTVDRLKKYSGVLKRRAYAYSRKWTLVCGINCIYHKQ
jgi:hypothetical protein